MVILSPSKVNLNHEMILMRHPEWTPLLAVTGKLSPPLPSFHFICSSITVFFERHFGYLRLKDFQIH